MTADAWKMILRSSKAQFIALSESGKLRKSSTGIEPYLNHGVRVQLDINKLQKVHRQVKSAYKQYTSITKPLYLFDNQAETAKTNDG